MKKQPEDLQLNGNEEIDFWERALITAISTFHLQNMNPSSITDTIHKITALADMAILKRRERTSEINKPRKPPLISRDPSLLWPTEAVREIINEDPDPLRRWTPKEIAAELGTWFEQGRVRGKADQDLIGATHTALRNLVKQQFLFKHQPLRGSRRSFYTKQPLPPEPDLLPE